MQYTAEQQLLLLSTKYTLMNQSCFACVVHLFRQHPWVCPVKFSGDCKVGAGQGTFYMDGHWYYQAIDTGLVVKRKDCDPDLPVSMDPKRIFKASVADNKDWNSFQPVTVIDRCVEVWTINRGGWRTPNDPQTCT
jgi:hypothetical protein